MPRRPRVPPCLECDSRITWGNAAVADVSGGSQQHVAAEDPGADYFFLALGIFFQLT